MDGEPVVYEDAVVNMTVFDHAPASVQRAVHEGGDEVLMAWWLELSGLQQMLILGEARARASELQRSLLNRIVT